MSIRSMMMGLASAILGSSWTSRASFTTAFGSNSGNAVCSNGSIFVAVGDYGQCATSSDGITWTSRASFTTAFGSNTARAVCSNGSIFVAVGASGKCATSP